MTTPVENFKLQSSSTSFSDLDFEIKERLKKLAILNKKIHEMIRMWGTFVNHKEVLTIYPLCTLPKTKKLLDRLIQNFSRTLVDKELDDFVEKVKATKIKAFKFNPRVPAHHVVNILTRLPFLEWLDFSNKFSFTKEESHALASMPLLKKIKFEQALITDENACIILQNSNLTDVDFTHCSEITHKSLIHLLELPLLKKSNLRNIFDFPLNFIIELAKKRSLTSLTTNLEITDEIAKELLNNPTLISINMGRWQGTNHADLIALAKKTNLRVFKCSIFPANISNLGTALSTNPTLKKVAIDVITQDSSTDEQEETLFLKIAQNKSLTHVGSSIISEKIAQALSRHPDLKKFSIPGNGSLKMTTLLEILQKPLKIAELVQIDHLTSQMLTKLGQNAFLNEVHFHENITSEALQSFLVHSKVKILTLQNTLDSKDIQCLANNRFITSLIIQSNQPRIKDADLQVLAKNRNITELELNQTPKITDKAVEYLAKMPTLIKLLFSYCQNLSDLSVKILIKKQNLFQVSFFQCNKITTAALELFKAEGIQVR